MGRLRHKVYEYDTQNDRQLKEEFMHGVNNGTITKEIMGEVTSTAEYTTLLLQWCYHGQRE